MGRDLLLRERVFREKFSECDRMHAKNGGTSLKEAILNGKDFGDAQTSLAAVFAFETALTALWESLGVRPQAVVGFGSAHAAGVLSLEDAMKILQAEAIRERGEDSRSENQEEVSFRPALLPLYPSAGEGFRVEFFLETNDVHSTIREALQDMGFRELDDFVCAA